MDTQFVLPSNGMHASTGKQAYAGMPLNESFENGFFTVNQQWTVKYWNKAAEKLLGVPANKIVGKNLWEEFSHIIPLNFYAVYQKAFLPDIPVHFQEYWAEMGAWFDVITYYADGILSVSFKSNTRSQPAAPPLQINILNDLYRFVTEVTNDCLWEWNIADAEIFWIDGGHKRVFGYNIENALIPQRFWESRLHPDDKERVMAKLMTVVNGGLGNAWEVEYRFRKLNDEYAHVHDRGHMIYEKEKVIRMIGATQDISARKETAMNLFESERKLSLIARQTVNGVIITDAEENITWVNDAFTRITGYKPEEALGKKPGSLLQGAETDTETIDYVRKQIQYRRPFDCDIVNYTKSGNKYWIHLQGEALLDAKGNCEQYFAIQTDITEKVLLENKLAAERVTRQQEITEAVLTAQENERSEIGKELHDNVNQILGATKLYIEMAKTDKENQEAYLDQAGTHVLHVIEEIRKISKLLIPQSINLMGLADSIKILVSDLSLIHPVKFKFTEEGFENTELDEKVALNIFRIIQEQVNNIIKHSAATQARIQLQRTADSLRLVIADNGKGCNTSERKHGVGIRNIRSRAELLHGSLSIISHPNEGYVLKVVLPMDR